MGHNHGTVMTREYVETVARPAYIWGWPLVNNFNRAPALFLVRGRIFLIRYGGAADGVNALRRVSLSLCRTM